MWLNGLNDPLNVTKRQFIGNGLKKCVYLL